MEPNTTDIPLIILDPERQIVRCGPCGLIHWLNAEEYAGRTSVLCGYCGTQHPPQDLTARK